MSDPKNPKPPGGEDGDLGDRTGTGIPQPDKLPGDPNQAGPEGSEPRPEGGVGGADSSSGEGAPSGE